MNLLRKLSTGALGAVIGVTSVIVIPLAAAGPAAAGDGPASCTAETGYVGCLRFTATGADQSFTVPEGVTSVLAKVWGSGGGGAFPFPGDEGGGGGAGGYTTGTLSVTPAATLTLGVGVGGTPNGTTVNYGNGGVGGTSTNGSGGQGSSGGGASTIWADPARSSSLLVAGGGGGAGGNSFNGGFDDVDNEGGGGGGGTTGASSSTPDVSGGGGTQLTGGAGASSVACGTASESGAANQGGAGNSYTGSNVPGFNEVPGGGGGGGWFGGGGGACLTVANNSESNGSGGPGGGGSGYLSPTALDATSVAGDNGAVFWEPALAGGSDDPLYDPGTGAGGAFGSGGAGEIVLEWTGPPTPADVTTTGTGTTPQSPAISVPDGGSLTLLDADSQPVTTLTSPNQGSYTVDSGMITFTPVAPFTGSANPVAFRVTDSTARSGDALYTPTVDAPDAPTPPALTSTGTATAAQEQTATIPAGGSITLIDGASQVDTVTNPDEGAYTLDPATGTISFAPALRFSGAAVGVTYQVTDAYGSTGNSTYQPTVTKPAAPSVPADPQSQVAFNQTNNLVLTLPTGDTAALVDPTAPNTIATLGGTWTLGTGMITFTPTAGYTGGAGPISYTITDAYGQATTGSYSVTVLPPAGPSPQPLTSVGNPGVVQSAQPVIPAGGSATFTTGANPFQVQVDEGVYAMDPTTFAVTFAPNAGFSGDPTPVAYRVTDGYGQSADSTYQPHVASAPVARAVRSSGNAGEAQHITVPVPVGGSAMLVRNGDTVLTRDVAGQGSFVIDPLTGVITFTPAAGFSGISLVTFRLTDSYSRTADANYSVTVVATGVASATAPGLVTLATQGTVVPVTCDVSVGTTARCDVTLSWQFNGVDSVVGSGSVVVGGQGAAGAVVVPVRLNSLGHYLAYGLGGVPATAGVTLWQVGNPNAMSASTTTRYVNNSVVAPSSVLFGAASAKVASGGVSYLNTLRGKFGSIRRITCAGDTDTTTNWLADFVVATGRADTVCDYLARGTSVATSTSVHSEPAGLNPQAVRRTDIRLYY